MTHISKEQNIERSGRIENALNVIKGTLSQYGYTELHLPIYEYYDLLQDTVFNFSDESIIRFIDRHTGKTLVLRPDFTPQVCRIVSGMENLPLPFRVSYNGTVFRSVEKDRGIKGEENQTGWEIFGESSIFGDIEIVLTANDALNEMGLNGFCFTFGDTLFLNRIKILAGEKGDKILEAVSERRTHDLKKLVSEINADQNLKDLIVKLPLAFGDIDNIYNLAHLTSFDKELHERVEFVKNLFSQLKDCGVDENILIFDAAESKGLDYYTGVHFEILHKSYGSILGSGGRYDKLMSKFGKDLTACGAALNIDNLLHFPICESKSQEYDYLVIGKDNFKKAVSLRKENKSVIFTAEEDNKENFIKNYAFKNII
ncbi:ATP phosphoribosyltransferase regulatory subunit [Mucispirillum schaedleri]|jgi:ATP phosphoribosyltransferase regulatory subunit|uniref:ATP phosphoribosyltransferase regulatory subunit n=1 Tax=Mucispirillum schaedleri ASF457 TaxID=1379858 RepID=V2QDT4_9BACT|nr:ATP phosphoribosyltransferase regulatory subunit [Mucispirillum schaedleri]MCX4359623.1 ATP phosphoribosyltransferase regulatory subunit [Mucispirillum schaedleri]USF24080.1 ATP phosphoribosyltransferase regulatory subunit [Mucispirillum schaedleri ASF457]SIW06267.1 ATP phosphoribosyltransferase regulatory subunit [Mucispirillum schaedleri ASF457]